MGKRLLSAALALSAAAFAAQAGASPVSTQPLAADEILVEVSSSGQAISPADLVDFEIRFTGTGATANDARRNYEAQLQRIRATAAAAGVGEADIHLEPPEGVHEVDDYANAVDATGDAGEVPEEPPAESRPSYAASATMTLRLRDASRAASLQEALRAIENSVLTDIRFAASDDGPARRAARAQALARARADAEAHAAALGMRVVRIVRITERIGMDMAALILGDPQLASRMATGEENRSPEIPVQAFVGVDFAIAPR